MKKEKEKKNRKKDKENGSGSGEAGNQDNFDAPDAVVRFMSSSGFILGSLTKEEGGGGVLNELNCSPSAS